MGRPLNILIVEDHPINQIICEKTLEKLGHRCQVVANGLEALRLIEKTNFDLVVMDCQMPIMDGYQTTIAIRSNQIQRIAEIPIIALTAHANEQDKKYCLFIGMNDYLAKPFEIEDLDAAIQSLPEKKEVSS